MNEDLLFLEQELGVISAGMLWGLHAICERAGSKWILERPETIEIVITEENAAEIYSWCRAITQDGYSVGMSRATMKIIKSAKVEAHEYLVKEARDPKTSIDRKIELVKLTSK